MAEDGRLVHLGLLAEASRAARHARPLVVRVVVLRRKTGDTQWQRVWGTDLMTCAEELVELTPEKAGGAVLRTWTQCLPDGMVAVDADLALDNNLPVRASSERNPARRGSAAGILPANRQPRIPGLPDR